MNKVCDWLVLWSLFWSKLFSSQEVYLLQVPLNPRELPHLGQLLWDGQSGGRVSAICPPTHPGLMLLWLSTDHSHLWTSVACRACAGGRGFFPAKLTGRPAWLLEGFSEAAGMTSDSHSRTAAETPRVTSALSKVVVLGGLSRGAYEHVLFMALTGAPCGPHRVILLALS